MNILTPIIFIWIALFGFFYLGNNLSPSLCISREKELKYNCYNVTHMYYYDISQSPIKSICNTQVNTVIKGNIFHTLILLSISSTIILVMEFITYYYQKYIGHRMTEDESYKFLGIIFIPLLLVGLALYDQSIYWSSVYYECK